MGNEQSYDSIENKKEEMGGRRQQRFMEHDAAIKGIHEKSPGKYIIFISARINEDICDGDPLLLTSNPNFTKIYETLNCNGACTFEIYKLGDKNYIANATKAKRRKITIKITGFLNVSKEFGFKAPQLQLIFAGFEKLRIIISEEKSKDIELDNTYEVTYVKNECERLYSALKLDPIIKPPPTHTVNT